MRVWRETSDRRTGASRPAETLNADTARVSPQARGLLWPIGLAALALRLALLPIGHWWDLTVDYNVFIDLGRNVSPYATMAWLSHIAQSAHWGSYYEYYAYPPAPLYLYYPLAQLFHWLHPSASYFFPVQGSFAMPSLPWDFYLLYKGPIWMADFAIAALLARMTGTAQGFRSYLLNPYVLLIGSGWTFDAMMVLGLLLGIYLLQRDRPVLAGIALGVGTAIKYVPVLLVPVGIIYLLKRERPVREVVAFVVSSVATTVLLIVPFWRGVLYVLQFQAQRNGGGMNWQVFFLLSPVLDPRANLDPLLQTFSSFGMPVLAIGLLLGYWYCTVAKLSLNRMVLLVLVIYLAATKLVNEQYVLVLFPFTLLEATQQGGIWKWLHRAFWGTALAFAIFRLPIDRLLWPLYHTVLGAKANVIALTGATGLDSSYIPWHSEHLDAYVVLTLGVWFTVLCLITIWHIVTRRGVVQQAQALATPVGVASLGRARG